jgi:hypothetical protein
VPFSQSLFKETILSIEILTLVLVFVYYAPRLVATHAVFAQSRVSLLTDFEDAQSYLDWTIGVHGIHITFPHPSLITQSSSSAPTPYSSNPNLPRLSLYRSFSATYLPEVMPEQGWNKLDAIDSAIQKAGWNGVITEDLRRGIKLRRYQSRKCCVAWDEYRQWREQKEAEA